MFFGNSAMRVTDIWHIDISYHHVMRFSEAPASVVPIIQSAHDTPAPTLNYDATRGWSRLKKTLYYFLFDNKTFWKKLKNRKAKR